MLCSKKIQLKKKSIFSPEMTASNAGFYTIFYYTYLSSINIHIHIHTNYNSMVFSSTFNNISAISWRSTLLMEQNRSTRRKPPTYRKSQTNFITKCYIEYTSPWARFEL